VLSEAKSQSSFGTGCPKILARSAVIFLVSRSGREYGTLVIYILSFAARIIDCFLPLIKCIQCLFMMTLNHTVCSIILICTCKPIWLWIMEQSVSLQWQQLLATMLMTNIYIYFRAFSMSNLL